MRGALRTRLGVAVAVLGCAAALAVWGIHRASATPGAEATQPAAVTENLLASLQRRVYGELADMRAGQFVVYLTLQVPTRDCMAKAGFDYTPPPFIDPYRSWTVPRPTAPYAEFVPVSDDHVTRHGLYVGEELAAQAEPDRGNPGHDRLDAAGQQRYVAQLGQCVPNPETYQDLATPVLARELAGEFEALFAQVHELPEVRSLLTGYPACMAAKGYPVADRQELLALVGEHFAGLVDPRTDQLSPTATAATLAQARTVERQAATADANCRRKVNLVALARLDPRLRRFEAAHADDLRRVAAEWAALRASADRQADRVNW